MWIWKLAGCWSTLWTDFWICSRQGKVLGGWNELPYTDIISRDGDGRTEKQHYRPRHGKGLITAEAVNIRDYSADRHHHVDDYPYGGGAGMVMQPGPVVEAYEALSARIGKRRE